MDSVKELEANFNEVICPILKSFVRDEYGDYFKDFEFNDSVSATNLLKNIISYIRGKKLPKMYIVIDEYDNFTNQLVTANKDDIYASALTKEGFLKTFFKNIKEGEEIEAIDNVFITGVLPITVDD